MTHCGYKNTDAKNCFSSADQFKSQETLLKKAVGQSKTNIKFLIFCHFKNTSLKVHVTLLQKQLAKTACKKEEGGLSLSFV